MGHCASAHVGRFDMVEKPPGFGVFGCSLDALDASEKVAMKLAYMDAVACGRIESGCARDPYDLLVGELTAGSNSVAVGKVMLESWVTPRPDPADAGMVSAAGYSEFLGSGGCAAVCEGLTEFVKEKVLPLRPLLVGVDHSLTGGVCEALAGEHGPDRLALIVLDSHFDAVPASVRRSAGAHQAGEGKGHGAATGGGRAEMSGLPESYTCGNWLADVLERGVLLPENVAVIGPSDHPGYAGEPGGEVGFSVYRRSYLSFEDRGVRVVPKRTLRHRGIQAAVASGLEGLEGKEVYLSIDADVAAGERVKAVRYLDTIGLTGAELEELFGALGDWLAGSGSALAGMDLMEIDVHLADIPGSTDRTAATFLELLKRFVERF